MVFKVILTWSSSYDSNIIFTSVVQLGLKIVKINLNLKIYISESVDKTIGNEIGSLVIRFTLGNGCIVRPFWLCFLHNLS